MKYELSLAGISLKFPTVCWNILTCQPITLNLHNCTNGTSCSSCILTNRLSFLTTMQGFIFYIKRYLYPQYYIFPLKGTVSRDFYQTIFSAKLTYFGFWLTLLKVFSNTAWISRKYSYRQSKKSLNNQCLELGILVLLLKYSPSI